MKSKGPGDEMGKVLLGVILGVMLVPVAAMAWIHWGKPPVAVADPPFPQERAITQGPLNARIDSELIKTPPIPVDETSLVAGAEIYRDQCASCHGLHRKPSSFGAHMYPDAPPLWEVHHHGSESHLGVTDDPPGETYWKVANGIRLTGMPSYKDILTNTQMWQVSLLLANADKPLPPAAIDTLNGAAPAAPAVPDAPAAKK
ncbi:MAG: cytochrome c [Terracidiphilus sp.]|nr:cytochrome c [Terracidiphilus sp.]